MKICHVTHFFYPALAGLENYLLNLSKYQVEKGYDVHVVTSTLKGYNNLSCGVFTPDRFPDEEVLDGIHIHRYNEWDSKIGWFLGRSYYKVIPPSFLKTRQVCKKEKVDVIHAHDIISGIPAYLVNEFLDVPYILTDYGSLREGLKKGIKTIPIYKMACRKATCLITGSKVTRNFYKKLDVPEDKIESIHIGIDTKKFHFDLKLREKMREKLGISEDKIVIIYLGRFIKFKGIEFLIDAMPSVIKKIPNLLVILAGDGPLYQNLKERVRQLNITNHILFTGFVSNPKDYLSVADIYASTSPSSSFNTSLLESLSMGIPSLITKCSDAEKYHFIDRKYVLFVQKPINIHEISEKIIELCSDPELCNRLSENSRELVEKKFDGRESFRKICTLYEKVLRGVK